MRALVVAAGLACACGSTATTYTPGAQAATEKPPITIAIIGMAGSVEQASEAEDGCVMAVLEGGYRAVERRLVLAALPDERDVDFNRVGRELHADLIIDGGVARGGGAAAAKLEPRLISSHSANVLATVSSKGRIKLTRAVGQKLCTELLQQLP